MKEKLKKILAAPAGKLIAIDLDGTLCDGEFWGGADPSPLSEMVVFVTALYHKGAHIVIYTARQPKYYPETHSWLLRYGVPFHGICMQMKPGADLYIDDKAVHPEDL